MSDTLEENTRDKIYIWIYEKNGKKDLMEGSNIFYLSENGQERGLLREK